MSLCIGSFVLSILIFEALAPPDRIALSNVGPDEGAMTSACASLQGTEARSQSPGQTHRCICHWLEAHVMDFEAASFKTTNRTR